MGNRLLGSSTHLTHFAGASNIVLCASHLEWTMVVTLIVTKGKEEGKIFRLTDGEVKVIGRSVRADIILHDEGISRQHCRVRIANDACHIADLNSKNGTAVNGRRLTGEATLKDEDEVDLGFSTLKVRVRPDTATGCEKEQPAVESVSEADDLPEVGLIPIEPAAPPPSEPGPETAEESLLGAFELFLEPGGRAEPESAEAEPIAMSIEPAPVEKAPVEPDPFIGKTVGGYLIRAAAGEDEISRVYHAVQLSMERTVCLKILSPEMTHDSRAVERFIRTARAGGKLSHPNIVQVYDAGEDSGAYYIALELVDGKPLRSHLQERGRNRPLPFPEAADITEQVADALVYAHAQEVIHRSITPDNIYITPHHVTKLADLGFSQSLSDSGIQRPSRFGDRPGNLQFSAPELLADPRSADARVDLYALGAVLFVMVTGHMPFRGETEDALCERIRSGRHENARRLHREVPAELALFVDRAMVCRPEERHASAQEFLECLRELRSQLNI